VNVACKLQCVKVGKGAMGKLSSKATHGVGALNLYSSMLVDRWGRLHFMRVIFLIVGVCKLGRTVGSTQALTQYEDY
jgi:hypothetical protein